MAPSPNGIGPSGLVDTVTLERLKVASQVSVARNVIQDAELIYMKNYIADSLVWRLESHVLSSQLSPKGQTFYFRWAASNWHKFKLRLIPQFLIRHRLLRKVKYHVESKTVEVRSWATFPEATISFPKELGKVRIMQETTFKDNS